MYGRIFESMFEGSMVGAGAPTFAVWSYVITKMREDGEVGAQVDLNPKLLATVLGEPEEVIVEVIRGLCSPDERSRSPEEEGKRLVRVGQFSYRVVNGAKYLAIRNLEQKRAADRDRKRKQRSKEVGNGKPLPGEVSAVKAMERGDEQQAEQLAAERTVVSGEEMERGVKILNSEGDVVGEVPEEPVRRITDTEGGRDVSISSASDEEPKMNKGSQTRGVESGQWVDGNWVPD